MLSLTISSKSRLSACLLLAVLATACSKQEEPAAGDATPAATATQAPPAPAVAASVQAMGSDQLRESATQALRENRMYAPAGDNAMEYYLALRDKLPDDAAVASALTDLLPYTLIAAEQAVTREQFDEALRLAALIEKTDPTAPALPRIRQSITTSQQAVTQRSAADAERVRREAEARTQADQQRVAAQQAAESEAARRLAAEQESAREAAERQATAQREADQRAAAARESAAAPRPCPCAGPADAAPDQHALAALSPEALRAGTSGEVLVEFTVGTDGAVTDARVLRANPARTFDREALNAVRRWRFEPIPAPMTTRRTVAFSNGG